MIRSGRRTGAVDTGCDWYGRGTNRYAPTADWAGARYVHDVETGQEHPKGPWAWMVGLRYGTTKGHSETAQDYLHGKVRK